MTKINATQSNKSATQTMSNAKSTAIGASIPPAPKPQSAAQTIADAVKAQGATAPVNAIAAVAALPLPKPKSPRISHIQLGRALAERNAPQSEIDAAFSASFASRGKDLSKPDVLLWVAARRDKYMDMGRKHVAARMPKVESK